MAKLISDQAVGGRNAQKTDGLGFDTYAEVLANAARDTEGPFTIGIFGEWGTGKTSLLNLVQEKLDNEPEVFTVWFNAWQYEQDEHPIVPLIATIISAVQEIETEDKRLKGQIATLLKTLKAVAYGISIKAKFQIPAIAGLEANLDASKVIDKLQDIRKDVLLESSLYYKAFETLASIEIPDIKIVVLIDDLDRCLPPQAVKLLESIKLVLSQKGFIFLIAVARKVIEGFLERRYEKEYGVDREHGRLYLDKIVQLPFYVPPHEKRMQELCENLIEQESLKNVANDFREILPIIGLACANNPRTVVRFLNNLLIDHEIYTRLYEEDKDVPLAMFAISRALEQRWQEFYNAIRSNQARCDVITDWLTRSDIPDAPGTSDVWLQRAHKVLSSDQNLAGLMCSSAATQWLNNEATRIRTTEFLVEQRTTRNGVDLDVFASLFVSPIVICIDIEPEIAESAVSVWAKGGVTCLIPHYSTDKANVDADIDAISHDRYSLLIILFGKIRNSRNFKKACELLKSGIGRQSEHMPAIAVVDKRNSISHIVDDMFLDLVLEADFNDHEASGEWVADINSFLHKWVLERSLEG